MRFQVANLDRDMSTCISFRKDSFFSSFDSDKQWVEQFGEKGEIYPAWLKNIKEIIQMVLFTYGKRIKLLVS